MSMQLIFDLWISRLSMKTLFMLCLTIVFVFGLVAGILVGEYTEMKFITSMMNESANTNQMIRNDDLYYRISPMANPNLMPTNLSNITITKD